MKIALASMDGEKISNHFGRSPYFLIFNVEKDQVKEIGRIDNTFTHHFSGGGQHHEHHEHHGNGAHHDHSALVDGLKGCQVVIAGGMGQGAFDDLTRNGFEVIITDESDAKLAVNKYIRMELVNQTDRLH